MTAKTKIVPKICAMDYRQQSLWTKTEKCAKYVSNFFNFYLKFLRRSIKRDNLTLSLYFFTLNVKQISQQMHQLNSIKPTANLFCVPRKALQYILLIFRKKNKKLNRIKQRHKPQFVIQMSILVCLRLEGTRFQNESLNEENSVSI